MHTISLVEDQWSVLLQFLPPALDASAKAHRAMRRQHGQIKSGEQLLRILLMHIAGGLSLEQTVARAKMRGLADLNAMALHKRLRTSRAWLEALTAHVLAGTQPLLTQSEDFWRTDRRIRILDATDIQKPGATGTDWRLHYGLRLPEMCCDFFELTDKHGGETLRRMPVSAGDVVLVDRAYNDRKTVAKLVAAKADVIMRYNSGTLPLLNHQGRAFKPLPRLRKLKIGHILEAPVRFEDGQGGRVAARLCALRKTTDSARRAQAKIKYKARGQGRVRPETYELANYVVIITTIGKRELPVKAVLEFYRARWQIELAFKRLKCLLGLGQLPKRRDDTCRAWMQGKILIALLIERMLCEARYFPPGAAPAAEVRQWNIYQEMRDALVVQLACPQNLSTLLTRADEVRAALSEHRPSRPRQLQRLNPNAAFEKGRFARRERCNGSL